MSYYFKRDLAILESSSEVEVSEKEINNFDQPSEIYY